MAASEMDLVIIRGDSDPAVVWKLTDDAGSPLKEPSSSFVLEVLWRGGKILRQTGADAALVYDADKGTVTWSPGSVETALLPLGRLASYTLQRRASGAYRTLVTGKINAVGKPVQ